MGNKLEEQFKAVQQSAPLETPTGTKYSPSQIEGYKNLKAGDKLVTVRLNGNLRGECTGEEIEVILKEGINKVEIGIRSASNPTEFAAKDIIPYCDILDEGNK